MDPKRDFLRFPLPICFEGSVGPDGFRGLTMSRGVHPPGAGLGRQSKGLDGHHRCGWRWWGGTAKGPYSLQQTHRIFTRISLFCLGLLVGIVNRSILSFFEGTNRYPGRFHTKGGGLKHFNTLGHARGFQERRAPPKPGQMPMVVPCGPTPPHSMLRIPRDPMGL